MRELGSEQPGKQLRERLGDIFQPRLGRRSRYRRSELDANPATLRHVEASLQRALSRGREPLLFYVTSHGERGEQPADNYVALWGGRGLSARRLAELHDGAVRPLRAVVTGCYSGGFAELAFEGADVARGPAAADRCGLFAGLPDRETSGCDPNPDRRAQQGYSLHFLHALAGRDRAGQSIDGLDLDGDGAISLLEAHARARIASRSIDVPTSTSERYLRQVQRQPAEVGDDGRELPLPEERAVVQQLGAALSLRGEPDVRARWQALDAELVALDAELSDAEGASDEAYHALAAALLSRWPVLDDAYHADFEPTLAAHGEAIAAALEELPQARAFDDAERRVRELGARYQAVLERESVVLRLLRAHETLALAAALARRGGADLEHYQRLLTCERHVPPR